MWCVEQRGGLGSVARSTQNIFQERRAVDVFCKKSGSRTKRRSRPFTLVFEEHAKAQRNAAMAPLHRASPMKRPRPKSKVATVATIGPCFQEKSKSSGRVQNPKGLAKAKTLPNLTLSGYSSCRNKANHTHPCKKQVPATENAGTPASLGNTCRPNGSPTVFGTLADCGSGKSHLLAASIRFVVAQKKLPQVPSPHGIATCHVGGNAIHRFANAVLCDSGVLGLTALERMPANGVAHTREASSMFTDEGEAR